MVTTAIAFDAMTPAHLDGALALSIQAGWPHRREDWEMSMSISRGVVGLEGEQVIATILMTPYGEDGATINLVIVDASKRGMGLGRKLMNEALSLAGTRTCYLVATQSGLPLYEKLGFVATGEVVQYQGEAPAVEAPKNVSWAGDEEYEVLVALDRSAYGHDRVDLMQALRGIAKFAVIRDQGRVQSFAAIRDFGRGQVIGPVVARGEDEARQLIDFLFAQNTGRFVRIDTNTATGLAPWLAESGLTHVGGGIAMVRAAEGYERGGNGQHWTYALASQALG